MMSKNKDTLPVWGWILIISGGIIFLIILLVIWVNYSTNPESLITEFIEDEGYTINFLELSEKTSELSMDGKGSLDMQAITGLMGMVRLYPDSKQYHVKILTDLLTCSYTINAETAEKVREDSRTLLKDFSLMNKVCY